MVEGERDKREGKRKRRKEGGVVFVIVCVCV